MNRDFDGVIRAVRNGDAAAIRPILDEWVLADDISAILEAVRRSAAGDSERQYLVAESGDGAVVGLMGLTGVGIDAALHWPSERPAELVNAYVAGTWRGRGVGRALAERLEQRAKDLGFTKLIVVSGSRNRESGYGFWNERFGEPIFLDRDFYGPGQEKIAWAKSLSDS
ncbi:MAG TPA: GNAT family N-acetyltransferase [Candidatus Saccharimonadia bacterium]|nr:GNAT family N-acetyltransferase [Candidatus Saccharimonadia bacterium]